METLEKTNSTPVKTPLSIRTVLINYNALFILLILIIISSLISPHFLTVRNIFNVLLQQVPYLLIALGVMLSIMSGGIDLSVGAIAGCGNVIIAIILSSAWGQQNMVSLPIGIAASLAIGCAIGAVNGVIIGKLRMQPFIVTLAMMSAAQGVAFMMTGGSQIPLKQEYVAGSALNWFASTRDPLGVPLPVYLAFVFIIVFWFIMRYTSFGRLVMAVGSNEAAVHLAGINVTKYKLLVYVISGGLAALAGAFLAGRTALGAPAISQGDFALTTVAACVIGGVSLSGGKGTVAFTVIGVIILALITNIMNLLGVASYPQLIIKGGIIILAIFLSNLGDKSKSI